MTLTELVFDLLQDAERQDAAQPAAVERENPLRSTSVEVLLQCRLRVGHGLLMIGEELRLYARAIAGRSRQERLIRWRGWRSGDQSVSFSHTLVMMTSPWGVVMSGGLRINRFPDTSKNRSVSVPTLRGLTDPSM